MKINTKFVNTLQPEWSRFFIAAKQVRNLPSVNFDQLYAFIKHNEKDAKEVREMRQRFLKPLALLLQATANFKADHVDAYDSDCNNKATANVIFMENLSPVGFLNDDTVEPHYDSDTLTEEQDMCSGKCITSQLSNSQSVKEIQPRKINAYE
nr:hypothetical protein [Tanacetum cinerariifolium]